MLKQYFILLILISSLVIAQPSITWQRLYNGPQSQDDDASAICLSDSGNIYIAGYSTFYNSPSRRLYVIKINSFGDTIWTKSILLNNQFGGSVLSLLPVSDGGCIFTGDANYKFIVRLNHNGNIVWQYLFNGNSQYFDLKLATNRDYIMAGISGQGGTVLRINNSGALKWDKIFPNYFFHDIQITNDNGCLVAGYLLDAASIVKLDSNGNLVWTRNYKINSQQTLANSFRKDTLNNNYILSGNYWNGTSNAGYFIKFNDNMNPLDTHKFMPFRTNEILHSMEVLSNCRYVWTFYFQSSNIYDSSFNRFLITDSTGNIIHSRVKYTKNYEELVRVKPLRNGDIIFIGDADYGNPELVDIYAIRTDSILNFPSNIIGISNNQKHEDQHNFLICYPNPSNNSSILSFQVTQSSFVKIILFDLVGREVKRIWNGFRSTGNYYLPFYTNDIASGIYILQMITEYSNTKIKISIIK